MEVFGVVYLIQNMKNGKKYVGQTTQPLEIRFNQHAHAKSAIGRSIRHNGIENFRYGVIKSCATREELNHWEKFFISKLKTKSPYGYNTDYARNRRKTLEQPEERLYRIIGRNIYKFRVLKQLSQAKLAERSNVSAAYISQIECTRLHKGITCTAIIKIAEALQVPACVLLAEETCPKYLQCLETINFFEEGVK